MLVVPSFNLSYSINVFALRDWFLIKQTFEIHRFFYQLLVNWGQNSSESSNFFVIQPDSH